MIAIEDHFSSLYDEKKYYRFQVKGCVAIETNTFDDKKNLKWIKMCLSIAFESLHVSTRITRNINLIKNSKRLKFIDFPLHFSWSRTIQIFVFPFVWKKPIKIKVKAKKKSKQIKIYTFFYVPFRINSWNICWMIQSISKQIQFFRVSIKLIENVWSLIEKIFLFLLFLEDRAHRFIISSDNQCTEFIGTSRWFLSARWSYSSNRWHFNHWPHQ